MFLDSHSQHILGSNVAVTPLPTLSRFCVHVCAHVCTLLNDLVDSFMEANAATEEAFLKALGEIEGVSTIETQTITVMPA